MRKPVTYLAVFFALTTLGAVAFALHEHRAAMASLEMAAKAAADDKISWEKRLADAQRRAHELEAELAAFAVAREAKAAPVVTVENKDTPDNRREARGVRRGAGDRNVNMMEDPEFVQLWATQQRGQLDGRYADLFKLLKLSPEALEKFKNLMVDKQNSFRDVVAAARAQGLDPRENRDQVRQLVQQANQEIDSNIQSALGAEAFSKYKQYEQTLPQRTVVSQIDQRLSYTSTPLNPSQSEQLVQILAQSAPSSADQNGGQRGRPGGFGGGITITDQAIAQASGILNPSQLAALQQLQSEGAAQQQMFRSLREQRASNPRSPEQRSPAPPPSAPLPSG